MSRERRDAEYQTILLLRWVLIVATSYLLLYHHPLRETSQLEKTFLAGYLASNLIAAAAIRRALPQKWLVTGIAAFDAVAVLGALGITHMFSLIGGDAPIRLAFLFVVALFFGHLVQRVSLAERRADEAQRSEKIITDSVEEVVRAFKIPLGAMHAISEILLESPAGSLSREQQELLRLMHTNSRHVSRFAASLLDARSIDADRLVLDRMPADLATIVEEALGVASTASDLKGVSLEIEAPQCLPRVHVDVNQMDRAVWNLLDNAIRSAPAGGEVFVSLGHTDRDVVLSVSDDGSGIAPDDLPAIFDKLRHVTSGFATSGFGLFVARAIIQAHGGAIEADSEVGGGTTLTVRLPIARAAALAEVEPRLPA